MAFPFDLIGEEDKYWTGPAVGDEELDNAQEALGVRLPTMYRELMKTCNGFNLARRFVPTDFETSWSPAGFEVDSIFGVGFDDGIDGRTGSDYLISEWGYPKIGVVFGITPSAGHDTVMLDYRDSNIEPRVAYIDEGRQPRVVAPSFEEFLELLSVAPD